MPPLDPEETPRRPAFELAIGPDYDYLGDGFGVRFFGLLLMPVTRFVLPIIHRVFLGLRVTGHKNLRHLHGGFVTVCNHVHPLDSAMVGCTLKLKRIHFLTLQANMERPVIRFLVRLLGGLPIPRCKASFFSFYRAVETALRRGDVVHVFPEGHLIPYCRQLRPFQNGAFAFAYDCDAPIVPMVITYRQPKGVWKKLRRRPFVTLHILQPVYPDIVASKRGEIQRIKNLCRLRMQEAMSNPLQRRRLTVDLQQWLAARK